MDTRKSTHDLGPIALSRESNSIPKPGTLCRTTDPLDPGNTDGFLVKSKHIDARKPGLDGVTRGWVPGAGGDLWWVEHADGNVGAYLSDEVVDRRLD